MRKLFLIAIFVLIFLGIAIAQGIVSNHAKSFQEKVIASVGEQPIPLEASDMVIVYEELQAVKSELCEKDKTYSWCK